MRKALALGLVLTLAGLAGCGYNFRGKQNNLPSDVRTVAIPVFENHTGELRIERVFTDETIFQFTRSQMLRLVGEGQADAVLKGIIKEVRTEDVALTRGQASSQRRLTIVVSASLTRRSDGRVLWEDRVLEKNRTYNVASSIQASDQNKSAAVTELAKDLAETLHDRVFENF